MTTSDKSQDEPDLDLVVGFLCGTNALDGIWYGDKVIDRPTFWWRSKLRSAIAANNARVAESTLRQAIKSINDEIDKGVPDNLAWRTVLQQMEYDASRPTATGTKGSEQ